ncbi:MAG: hypothetical protein DHS20C15_23440 [Planctomycetota bacterium]|nr:MAG: hypothetical protein DHS20C15_23440 [Planctomycetota bacterium]
MQIAWSRALPGKSLVAFGLGLALTLGAGWLSQSPEPTSEEEALDPFFACFDQGTSPSVMEYWYQRGAYKPGLEPQLGDDGLAEYFLGGNWNGQGAPASLTWSFLPDGYSFPGSVGGSGNSSMFSTMDSKFGGDTALWISRFEATFNRWSLLTGLDVQRVTNGGNEWDDGASWNSSGNANRGDIRIGMRSLDGGGGTLAFAFFPGSGGGGNMVFDTAESWNGSQDDRLLRNTLFHELGHSFGINHVCPTNGTKLMEPFLNTNFVGPRHDDLRAAHRLYGDAFENNNSAGAAHDFGDVDTSGTFSPCEIPGAAIAIPDNSSLCSLDANGEVDFYEINVTEGNTISVTVSPTGLTYSNNSQAFNGSCNTGSSTNSLDATDLAVQVIAANGVTVLATSDSAGVGQAETITDLNIGGPGTIFIRVYETGSLSIVQMYDIDIDVEEGDEPGGEFIDIGPGVAGLLGTPSFTGTGDLTPGSAMGYSTTVTGAIPFNTGFLFLGLVEGSTPFKMGTLYPSPFLFLTQINMTGAGNRTIPSTIDLGTPSGLEIIAQWWFADAAAVSGASASNGLKLVVP